METTTTSPTTTPPPPPLPSSSATEVRVRRLFGSQGGGERDAIAGFDAFASTRSSNNSTGSNKSGLLTNNNSGNGNINDAVEERGIMEYFGWVYHLGTNSFGHEYCHLRFLLVRGKRVYMFKRDPQQNPGVRPIRKGVVGPSLKVEEVGRRKVNSGDLYVIRFYNRLDEKKMGEIACGSAGEARTWMEAFDQAKQQAEFELSRGASARNKLNLETEINLEGHRPRVRRYAHELKKLIRIGQGPEALLRQSSTLGASFRSDGYFEGEAGGDAIEAHEWRCVHTINGVRIFEDVSKSGKGALVKAVAVIDASADAVFDVLLNVDRHQRYEWDMLTADLELLDSYDGHYDVVYGTYDPKYLTRWQSSRDFVFSRQWFRGQDRTYTILQFPAMHKMRPPRSGYRRTNINRLKEYIGANPALRIEPSSTVVHSKISDGFIPTSEYEDATEDEFYDAIAAGASSSSSSSSEGSDDEKPAKQDSKVKLKNVSWAIASLALKRTAVLDANKELDPSVPPFDMDSCQLHGSLHKGKDDNDSNCWTSPNGTGFMIRGKTYLKDYSKVKGGEPLLKLVAVDWFKVNRTTDHVALHPRSLVQTEAGKSLPLILLINLQNLENVSLSENQAMRNRIEIPSKPNYSMVLYYASERPANEGSLLGKFIDGTDMFRDSRFKLIPSIIEGYWMVKRAVGTKACLLGKAVTCKYLRQDNFLEIDVDIGSSSVARSVIGLVLGYVTSLVVDLAILIEAKEEEELPEYVLGTVRLNRVRLESAVPLEV